MVRSRTTMFALALFVAPLAALFVSACGGGGEEQSLIRNYFLAARLNDRPTLNNIAMVAWNSDEQGRVSGASVESVEEEQSRPLRLRELSQELTEAQQRDEEFSTEMVTYQEENFEAINRVLEAETDGDDVASGDVEVQEAWTDLRNRNRENAKMVSDARVELTSEQNAASLSVFDPNDPLDLTQYDGELVTKDVAITANVELDGTESEQAMTVTLQKAVLTASDGTMIDGRWVIGDIN